MNSIENSLQLYNATSDDIPLLAAHHRTMFAEIWQKKGEQISQERLAAIEQAYREKLEQELATGICHAWIVKDQQKAVASGAVTICSFVPAPQDLSYKIAFLHSIYTEKNSRNRNCAHIILDRATQFCKEQGIQRILLTASDAGRPMYQKIGFEPITDMMRLFLPDTAP